MTSDSYDPMRHNYMREVLKLKIKPGTECRITVLHDDWCAIHAGGYCNCIPELIRDRSGDDAAKGRDDA